MLGCVARDLVWSGSRAAVPTAWRKLIYKRISGFRFSKDSQSLSEKTRPQHQRATRPRPILDKQSGRELSVSCATASYLTFKINDFAISKSPNRPSTDSFRLFHPALAVHQQPFCAADDP
jgi:hypothetical protein